MASRGRGQRMPSFTVDAVRGDGLPPSVQQPTPVFPVMEQKPLPLTGGEEAEYLLALKQDFRGAMRSLPCFIQPVMTRRGQRSHSAYLSADVLELYCERLTCASCFLSRCGSLEKKEEQEASEDEEGEMKKKQEEEAEGEEEYDEEEFEEETDYIVSHFDNGEDFGGESDDNMDEAIY
uniref:DNA-directed RNA polymerase III subunit n=1 Tax=Amphilophus citrinellus TaxID=61819 RepID=A0A3Q0R9T7_AMPCI